MKIAEIPDPSATYTQSFAVNARAPVQQHLAKGVATDNPNKAPIWDTGATRCLLHLSWVSEDVIEKAERIRLGVANGTKSRALFYNNVMYSPSMVRPLISIGQLKATLDLRFVWDDGPPILVFRPSGLKYVLIRARVFHGLPIVSQEELKVLNAAIEDLTFTGNLWSYHDWHAGLDNDFEIFGDSARQDHPQTIEEEDSEMLHTSRKGPKEQNILLPKSTFRKGTEDRECNIRKCKEKRVHFNEPNVDEDRKGLTGLIAEDATNTHQGQKLASMR